MCNAFHAASGVSETRVTSRGRSPPLGRGGISSLGACAVSRQTLPLSSHFTVHQVSLGVDSVNQMALQMRQIGGRMTWLHAVCAFALQYAVVNAYATSRSLGAA